MHQINLSEEINDMFTTLKICQHLARIAVFIGLSVTATNTASACYYADAYQDNTKVYSTMTTYAGSAGNWIRATAHLDDPGYLRYANADTGDQQAYSVTAIAALPINLRDGTYHASGSSYEYYAEPAVYQGGENKSVLVTPWVYITGSSSSPATIGLTNASGSYTGVVETSLGCSGTVGVTATAARPNGMELQISADLPDGTGTKVTYTALATYTFAGGEQHNFVYTVTTTQNNSVRGDVVITPALYSRPAGCIDKAPPPGATVQRTIKVN